MCQSRTSGGEKITTEKIAAIVATQTPENSTVATQEKRTLNPAAVEFVSSPSESEATSIGDEAETEQHLDSKEVSATEKNRDHKDAETQRMDQYYEESEEQQGFHGYQNYGWESPQGVLPQAGGISSPGPGVAYTVPAHPPGMIPPPHYSSNPHPHQYGPSHYPVYHLYSHHPDGIERSASPPAIYPAGGSPPYPAGGSPPYPAGGSPPLAPGFISVPITSQHSGHLRGSSPVAGGSPPSSRGMHPAGAPMPVHPHHAVSMGSSPPTNGDTNGNQHYHVYAPPHNPYAPHQGNEEYSPHLHHLPGAHPNNHHHHPYHHQHYDATSAMMAELQPRMSSMSLGGSQTEGNSPTSSGGIGIRSNTRASARIARSHRAGGAYNPSDFEFKISPHGEDNGANGTGDVKTTVMVRNIPNKYTQEIMLSLLEEAGLNGSFDFFYLPIDFRNRCGLGYAFLNFLSHADAVEAYNHFHNRRWDEFNSKKVCEVTYARVQGRDNLVQHFKNAKFPSTDAEYCPLVYRHSQNPSDDTNGSRVQAYTPLPIHEYLASLKEEEQNEVTTTDVQAKQDNE